MTGLRGLAIDALDEQRTIYRKEAIKSFKDMFGLAPNGIEHVKGTPNCFIFNADGLTFRVSKVSTLGYSIPNYWVIEVKKVDGYSWQRVDSRIELAKLIEYGSV